MMIHQRDLGNIALEDISKYDAIPSDAVDWSIYLTNSKTILEYSTEGFMPLQPGETHTLIARKPDRYLVYVLCPSKETYDEACEDFKEYAAWMKPLCIPTTFYLEGVMYSHILKRRQKEWEHADYVGTLAHSAVRKLNTVSAVLTTLRDASREHADVAAFKYMGDSLVATAEKWHPGFLRIWAATLRYLGFPMDKIVDETIPSYYCNYWAATPEIMKEYMNFFKVFIHALDTLPVISDEVWGDASYSSRGSDIAALTSEQCMHIWGVEYYPFHPFILERIPCFYFWCTGKKLVVAAC